MYQSAAVKLFAKRVGNDSFTIRLSIDDQVLTFPAGTIPMIWRWHEIPVDISRLRGKAAVTLYIRANGASENGYLQIAGDQDTPTRYSMLNFQQTNDLSSEEGAQRGEYVIRFILKK